MAPSSSASQAIQPPLFELPPAQPSGQAMEVFTYWAHARHRALGLNGDGPKQIPTQRRLSKVKARLGEGYTVTDLKRAVDGVLASDYHLRGGYTDIELICRDQAHVERYIEMAPVSKKKPAAGFYR